MAGLKTFDAFPKTEERHVRHSSKGGLSSIFTYLFLLFIAWTEFGSYFGGYIDEQYIVDNEVSETVPINLDLYVNMPCEWLDVNSRDITGDRKLVNEDGLRKERMFFNIPSSSLVNGRHEITTPNIDEILGEAISAEFREAIDIQSPVENMELNACHIFGSIPVNKVKGELQITAKGWGYRSRKKTPAELIDFSHVINELSFGPFYPYIDNPLDNTAKLSATKMKSYYYFTSIIPTMYKKLGAEVDTNQYSLSDVEYSQADKLSGVPGIFLRYHFEAMKIIVSDERIGFFQFIIRLVALLSFILYIFSFTFNLVDTVLIFVFGPKWSLRFSRDGSSTGILDE